METIPHAPQFEKTVLGAILNEPDQLTEVVNLLTPECFYDPVNGKVYEVIRQMFDENAELDLYTVGQRCRAIPELANVLPHLVNCTQSIGSGANLLSHARIVKQKFIARNLVTVCHKLIGKASDESEDILDTIEYFNREADNINALTSGHRTARPVGDILSEALKAAEKRQVQASAGEVSGITTGISELDRMTGGWQSSQLIILAARPAMGKTALMLHFAKAAALSGVPVCIYSLEMSDISLANRLILSECDVEADRFRTGRLTPEDWPKLERAANTLRKLPIYVDDNPVVSMRYIKSHGQIMKKRGKCGLILVDYLQLADTALDKKNRNREQEIAQASRQAKIIAKELDVPVILLSQLSRECEKRADKTPILSDLRESGAIEQDADIVSFIFRPAYYGVTEFPAQGGTISTDGLGILSIAKQRDGATGQIPFRHNPAMSKITDYLPGGQPQHDKEPF